VPEIGTARRAALPNVRSAGKTGTTQSYRDAWYIGFTGNYTAAVWMGNDDFHPTRNMTGGSLPAMTWERLMEYAHKNIDLKPIPGIENPFVDAETAAKAEEAAKKEAEEAEKAKLERPAVLSPATTQLLRDIANRFHSAPPIEAPPEPKTLSALEQVNSE
jgi:penicillin-binding protein 1A